MRENFNYLIYCFKGKIQFCDDSPVPFTTLYSFFASRDAAEKSPYVLFGTHSSRKYISEGSSAVSSDLTISQAGVNHKPATHMVSVTKNTATHMVSVTGFVQMLENLESTWILKKNLQNIIQGLESACKKIYDPSHGDLGRPVIFSYFS